jgi:hypothetical protein
MIPTVAFAIGKSRLSVILALLCCFLVLVKKSDGVLVVGYQILSWLTLSCTKGGNEME